MIWHTNKNDSNSIPDRDNIQTPQSTIHSVASDKLIPPTPSQANLFSRAFHNLFGSYNSDASSNDQVNAKESPALRYADVNLDQEDPYTDSLNQSMRTFHNRLKRVNFDDYTSNDNNNDNEDEGYFYDSDEELNETLNSIRNITLNKIPGTYPGLSTNHTSYTTTPYIPRNYKVDENNLNDKLILETFLRQTAETNKFLEELLTIQQYERNNKKDQNFAYITLKKELANELETSKQVYEGFKRLLLKYRSLKNELKFLQQSNGHKSSSSSTGSGSTTKAGLEIELQMTKKNLEIKSQKIIELHHDLKRLTDQRDDLKTTILEYKNQNLRLKTTNELLQKENTDLKKHSDSFTGSLSKKNEMLELQITQTNDMFKSQTKKFKEQIFELKTDLKKQQEIHEFEISSKDKKIQELERLLAFNSPIDNKRDTGVIPYSTKTRSSNSRPASYHEPSTRILSPIRPNILDYRGSSNNGYKYNSSSNKADRKKDEITDENNFSISDLSALLNNSQDLTGFHNNRVTNRLMNNHNDDNNNNNNRHRYRSSLSSNKYKSDLDAIFSSPP